MTARQLIEALSKLPPETTIRVWNCYWDREADAELEFDQEEGEAVIVADKRSYEEAERRLTKYLAESAED